MEQKSKIKKEKKIYEITAATTRRQQIEMVIRLSIPAILAEISSVVMQYIDAAMVGSLGADASASIGLVSSSTWLIGGLCISAGTGFAVQVSQLIGGKKDKEAKNVVRQALVVTLIIGCLLSACGILISGGLPAWLGGAKEIRHQASRYFLIYCAALPAVQMRQLSGSMLQCSGDMKTPSILNTMMCGLDVIFNAVLIFPARSISLFGLDVVLPGANLGVTGAALGTALAEYITAAIMLWFLCVHSHKLRIIKEKGSWKPTKRILKRAAQIALPMGLEHTVMCGAQVMSTRIVAPLGTVAVAANSLGVTAESVCYMPGYGIGAAATTLVGQSVGARNKEMARRFARVSVLLGVGIMTVTGGLMFLFAPQAFALLTPDMAVRQLGTKVLRIETFAEPFYGMSIVVAGALRGAGDTLVPSLMNLFCMWGVRITAAWILAPYLGLTGVWIAMCGELCVRGILFFIRLMREKWLHKAIV